MKKILDMFRLGKLSMNEKMYVAGVGSLALVTAPTLVFAATKLNTGVGFIDNLGNTLFILIQFLYFIIVSWMSIKFLRDKAYGQFWGFLMVALIIYMVVFQNDVLGTITNQLKTLVGGGGSTGGGTGGTGGTPGTTN